VTKPPLLTVAIAEADEVQVAPPVRSLVLPSLKLPVALICCVPPWMIEADVGATVIEVSVGFTKKPRQPAAKASRDRAANVAKMRRFRLRQGMVKRFRQTYFFVDCPLEVAMQNCSREGFSQSEPSVLLCALRSGAQLRY